MSIVHSTDGRLIGNIEDGVFFKHVKSEHQLRKPPAWATDADSFDKEVVPNCHRIVLINTDSGKRYATSVEVFIRHRIEFNRGYGRQYALPLRWWEELFQNQRRML